jgi:hypothetical protein
MTLNLPKIDLEETQENKGEHAEKKMVLRHLVRREKVLASTYKVINMLKYFESIPMFNLVWIIVEDFFKTYTTTLSKEALNVELQKVFNISAPEEDGYTEAEMLFLLEELFQDTPFADQIVLEKIASLKKEHHLKQLSRPQLSAEDVEASLEGIRKAGTLAKQSAKPVEVNIFKGVTDLASLASLNSFLIQAKRNPTGVDFIDRAFGGGVLPGEVIGFIMPTKTGKTTLGLQLACECVLRKKHVVYVQFEQLITGDLAQRQLVLASGGTRKDWNKGDITQVDIKVQEKLLKGATLWAEYMHCFDTWVTKDNPLFSPSDIYEIVQDLNSQGKHVDLVILDWWGLLKGKLQDSNGIVNDNMLRQKQAAWMHEIKACTSSLGVTTFIFHQVAGAAAARKKGMPSAHDGQGDKDWPNLSDACFVSGRKDSDSNVTFTLDTSRSTANVHELKVHLDGEGCRFISDGIDSASMLIQDISEVTTGITEDIADDLG